MIKRIASFFIVFSLVIFFLFLGKISSAGTEKNDYAADQILVKFKSLAEASVIKIPAGADLLALLNYYQNLSAVEYAEPDYQYHASIVPTDTYINNQWYLQKIKAYEAWDSVRQSPNVIIAVLDSGVQINHPDLKDNIWVNKKEIPGNGIDDDKNGFIDDRNGWDFVNNVPDPTPKFQPGFTEDGINHGTIVAGIIAAAGNNSAGIAGLTWKAQIMPLKVLDDSGEGGASKVIKAIDYAIANGANIINLSFVGFGYSQSLDEAVKRANNAGVIVVAAGGNEQSDSEGYNLDETPMYPACLDGVIGVAATDTMDQKAVFSSFGGKCIDIAAPGVSIFSTVVYSPSYYYKDIAFDKYYDGYWSGTSVAVPMVSAGLALIETANPSFNRDQVISTLYNSADNINAVNPNYLDKLGHGRINLAMAVAYARQELGGQTEKLLIAPRSGQAALIKITDQDGKTDKEFNAFNKFKGGISLASGDLNRDGSQEIVVAPQAGGGPQIQIFNSSGQLKGQFMAFKKDFHGGVNVVCADLNHDGNDEIIAAQASNGNSEIKVFNGKGIFLGSFYAYDSRFRGGLNLAAGDLDGDGQAEIVTGLSAGKIPEVQVFKANGMKLSQFLAYDKNFRGGVRVAVAALRGGTTASRAEIVVAPEKNGGPNLKLFSGRGSLLGQFMAFNDNFSGGVNLAAADVDSDGLDEIVAGAGPGGAPHVRVFKYNGRIVGSFYAYSENFSGGVNVGAIKIIK